MPAQQALHRHRHEERRGPEHRPPPDVRSRRRMPQHAARRRRAAGNRLRDGEAPEARHRLSVFARLRHHRSAGRPARLRAAGLGDGRHPGQLRRQGERARSHNRQHGLRQRAPGRVRAPDGPDPSRPHRPGPVHRMSAARLGHDHHLGGLFQRRRLAVAAVRAGPAADRLRPPVPPVRDSRGMALRRCRPPAGVRGPLRHPRSAGPGRRHQVRDGRGPPGQRRRPGLGAGVAVQGQDRRRMGGSSGRRGGALRGLHLRRHREAAERPRAPGQRPGRRV